MISCSARNFNKNYLIKKSFHKFLCHSSSKASKVKFFVTVEPRREPRLHHPNHSSELDNLVRSMSSQFAKILFLCLILTEVKSIDLISVNIDIQAPTTPLAERARPKSSGDCEKIEKNLPMQSEE